MKKIVWLCNEYETNKGITEYSSAITWWYGVLESLGYSVIYYPYETYNPEKFYVEMKEYKPDYIIHPCYTALHTEFIKLREFTKILIIQSDDDWRYHQYARLWIPFVDGIITLQGDKVATNNSRAKQLIDWYTADNAENVYTLRCAFNPHVMLTDELCKNKDIFVSHGGSLYGERPVLIQQFKALGIDVQTADRIPYSQLLDLWNRSKFSLSFTKASDGQFRQKKGRVAEIGYYSVIVSEPFPNIEEYYEPGKEIILFNSVAEAVEQINQCNVNGTYDKMLAASRTRCWNSNTAFHVWNKLMSEIDPDYVSKDVSTILKQFKQPT